MSAHVKVEIETVSAAACTVVLRGEHDLHTADAVATVMELARAYRDVLVDLEQCTFLDSSLINALLQAAKHARERGGALELIIAPGGSPVRRTLEIARIDALLVFHPSRPAGVASIRSREQATIVMPRGGHSLKAKVENVEDDAADSAKRLQHRDGKA
jgi:anti-anti-sigma factor